MKKKKAGEISIELAAKAPESRDPIELQREMTKEYCDEVIKCALDGKKVYPGNFYVVVITKRERLMQNVLRSYYFHRSSCPTPDWDQAVYLFHADADAFSMLWVIPDKQTCDMLYDNALEIIPEERELLNYVLDYYNGTLLKKAKQLNGERSDSPIIER